MLSLWTSLAALLVASPAATSFSDEDLSIRLPPVWTKMDDSTSDRLKFRDESGSYRLTVSVLRYAKDKERDSDFDRILQHRIDAEKRAGFAQDVKTGATRVYGSGHAADFGGVERGAKRSFAGRVMMAEGLIVVAYLEGLNKTPAQFSAVQASVLAGVDIAKVRLSPGNVKER